MKTSIIILFIVSCLAGAGFGQQPDYLFHRLGVNEGLAQMNPSFSAQDSKGYIWITGKSVLQRYDGHRFMSFFCGRNSNLPAGTIAGALMDSSRKKVWLIIEENFGYFDTELHTYTPVKVNFPEGYAKASRKMYADRNGNILIICKYKGIVTYSPKAGEAAPKYNPFVLPEGWQPHTVCQDDKMNYWISTMEGLIKYNSKSKTISYRNHNEDNDPVISACENEREMGIVFYDRHHRLWVASFRPAHSMKSFHTVTGEVKQWKGIMDTATKSYTDVLGMFETGNGSLWMYGVSLLASVQYERNSIHYYSSNNPEDYSVRYDIIEHFSEDREKSIWLCSNKGLFRFNPPAHLFYTIRNRMPNEEQSKRLSVTAFLELDNSHLLVSTWGGGVFGYDHEFYPTAVKFAKGSRNNEGMVWCMLQRKNGDVWKGMQEGHLVIDEAIGSKSTFQLVEATGGKTIRQLCEDKAGNIWLGTQQGRLIKWDPATKQFFIVQEFQRTILRLYNDSRNRVWACTDNDGVYCINAVTGNIIHHYTSAGKGNDRLLVNVATDIVEYNDSTFVIAANGYNILNPATGRFRYWDEGSQLFSLVLDRKKNLWASTNVGIVCRKLQNEQINYSFDARDGVSNFAFNTGSAILLKNGKIAFGTNHDFILFDPEKALDFSVGFAEVYISGIVAGDSRLPVDSVLRLPYLKLPHDRNSLTVRFTHNQFQTLQSIYYKLEGKDKDWKQVRYDGEVNLNYLPPGTYTLTAASFDENLKPVKTTSLQFIIATPFYQSWWFYSLLVIAAIGLLYWFDRERTRRKEAVQKTRTNIAGQLHEEINTALNNINILSEMARLKAETEPDKAVEFIEQIHGRSHNMIIAMDDMLWSIAPENDNMIKAVERMNEYIQALNNRYGVQIEMQVDDKVGSLKPDMQLRHEAFLLFKDSIKSLTDAGVRKCRIHLSTEKSQLLYSMQFDTSSIDMQQLNNLLERQDMVKRLEAIHAKITITPNRNTILMELKVPV